MSYQKFYSNQIHSSSLLCQLSQLWKSQILCDAIIRTGTVITKAHRLVLIAACPMLQSMENAAAGSHLEVKLSADIKQDSVNTFLQYLYEGFMMLTEDNIKDVEKIARLLQVDGVTKCCADFYKCLQASGVYIQPAGQYKYSFQDLVEFRHVRSSNVVKSAQVLKRSSDFVRPVSPGMKRPKMHSQPANISSPKEDLKSSSDPWERVPGLGLHSHSPGRHQSDPIEVMEDGLEIVQSDPVDVNKPHGQQHSTPKSVAISIASQVSDSVDVRVLNMGDSNSSVKNINSSQSHGEKSCRDPNTASSRSKHVQNMHGPSPRTAMQLQGVSTNRTNYPSSSKSELGSVSSTSKTNEELLPLPSHQDPSQSPFPVGLISAVGAPQKPFAIGSAGQSTSSFAVGRASQSPTAVASPHAMKLPHITDLAQGHEQKEQIVQDPNQQLTDMQSFDPQTGYSDSGNTNSVPDFDLSIVKIESTTKDQEMKELNMYLGSAEDGTMLVHSKEPDLADTSEVEYEDFTKDESDDVPSAGAFGAPSEQRQGLMLRPGMHSPDIAAEMGMVELIEGSGVYLYPAMITRALMLGEDADKSGRNGERMARYLLTQFFSARDLIGKTLACNNPKREQVNPFIVEAITSGFFHPTSMLKLQGSLVKPGMHSPEAAASLGMVELIEGSGVYLYPAMITKALTLGEDSNKGGRNGERMARYLLTQFFSARDLIGKTLACNNPKREQVNPFIVEAITSFCSENSRHKRSIIRKTLANKVSAHTSMHFKASQNRWKKWKYENFLCARR